jgi:quercetin dioxygenase-like cupin family protein
VEHRECATGEDFMVTDASETPRERAHHVTDPLIEVDLAIELAAVRVSDSYHASDHAAKTIAKHPGVRVVLIALKPGGQMHEHHADSAITVQGIDGHVEFTVGETAIALTRGRLLTVPPGVSHRVKGMDESAFLLTIGGAHDPSLLR